MRIWTVEEQQRWEIEANTREEALAVYRLLEPVDTEWATAHSEGVWRGGRQ